MKKIYLLALAAMIFAACTQENTEIAADSAGDPSGDHVALTRAVPPALTQTYLFSDYYSACLDAEGYLYAMYSKDYWVKVNKNESHNIIYDYRDLEFVEDYRIARSACVDIYDAVYFITPDNKLVKVVWNNKVHFVTSLTQSFPNGSVFLSLTAADNGNVFVTTGNSSDGDYGATFPDHTVYRIAAGGNVTEIATVNAPVAAIQLADWSKEIFPEGWLPRVDHIEYPNILLKANGSLLYGLSSNGNCYKITATTGAVEYFTPRVPVKCLAGSLNGNNPYALSGNTIVELRPNLAKDIEVGTIPTNIAQNAHTLRVTPDATTFYVLANSEFWISDDIMVLINDTYKFTR